MIHGLTIGRGWYRKIHGYCICWQPWLITTTISLGMGGLLFITALLLLAYCLLLTTCIQPSSSIIDHHSLPVTKCNKYQRLSTTLSLAGTTNEGCPSNGRQFDTLKRLPKCRTGGPLERADYAGFVCHFWERHWPLALTDHHEILLAIIIIATINQEWPTSTIG